jgi:phosphatidylglycerophosphate synthase
MTGSASESPFRPLFQIIDAIVEQYLAFFIQPFLKVHEKIYSGLNQVLRAALDNNKDKIPVWFTANFITYVRTMLVIPCLVLLSWGQVVLPSIIVVAVDFGDFLDGVVARYWVDVRAEASAKDNTDSKDSDDDSFEVVSSRSSRRISSWQVSHQNKSYGGFIDAVCDKAFVVPCWILLLSRVSDTRLAFVQYVVLFCLILAETASGSIRFRAYYSSGGVPAPTVKGLDFSSSAVKADHVGKAKQTFEMVGTALFILPFFFKYIGLVLLMFAVPLAYESVRRKVNSRVIYVDGTVKNFDHKTIKFWTQAKGMGSKLVVGVQGTTSQNSDMVLNACASSRVDEVMAEAPSKIDLYFLDKNKIDYIVLYAGQTGLEMDDDVLNANRCLGIGEDGSARPVKAKGSHKE